jgi:protoporphyrinogen/coproporphyrinogen III oxidase
MEADASAVSSSPPVIVIGGGIAGLTAAYELTRRGLQPTLFEASPRAGGLIQTERVGGFTIEAGPDSLLAQKVAALDLCRELGLESQLQSVRPPGGAFVLRGQRLYRLPSPSLLGLPIGWRALIRYELLPITARARLAMEPFVPARRSTDDESVAAFFRRRFGPDTVGLIAQPLLGGIHAGDIEQLSMQALFPRLVAMERAAGSVLRGARRERAQSLKASREPGARKPAGAFVAFRGGMDTLVKALLAQLGDAVRVNSPVTRLQRAEDGWLVTIEPRTGVDTARGNQCTSSPGGAVIIAAPAFVASQLLQPLDADAARQCAAVPYVSTASVALAWPRHQISHPLVGTGFVVARRSVGRLTTFPGAVEGRQGDARITACTWVSQKWEDRAPEDMALLRAFIGGAHDPDVVDLNDDELTAIARQDLAAILGITASPVLARVYRWRRAGAQHLVGHPTRMDALDRRLAALPGLFVAGSGFRSVGIPDCIAEARAAAARAAEFVRSRH